MRIERSKAQFPTLPLLESVHAKFFREKPLEGVGLVCVQHLLETTGSLFEKFMELGLRPGNAFILGKIYSTNESVVERLRSLGFNVLMPTKQACFGAYEDLLLRDCRELWQRASESFAHGLPRRIVALDDGGSLLAAAPPAFIDRFPVCGVEQTMSGLVMQEAGRVHMPVVQVATSAAKKLIEPHMIQQAIFRRIRDFEERERSETFGVVGLGSIGLAVLRGLQKSRSKVYVFDKYNAPSVKGSPRIVVCSDLRQLFEGASTIFGCTGRDILEHDPWWPDLYGTRTLISCSSHDAEFRTVLRETSKSETRAARIFDDLEVRTSSGLMKIMHGGFPINFDGSAESVPAAEIQLTRALLLAGVIQASRYQPETIRGYASLALNPDFQSYAVLRWLELAPSRRRNYPQGVLDLFRSSAGMAQYTAGSRRLYAEISSAPDCASRLPLAIGEPSVP